MTKRSRFTRLMPHSTPVFLASLEPAALQSVIAVWLFATGGAIGSFLNVVVYRLPAGKSLVHPGSHCPECKHPIRWHDNIPILGWVLLRGRCRDCATKISARYPVVEAVTAALFVLVGVIEGISGGANLPIRPIAGVEGPVTPLLDIGQLGGIVAYHLLLLCTLLAAALIEYDAHRLRLRLLVPALVVGWSAPLAWPHLHPVPAWPGLSGPPAGLVDGTAGLAVGLLLGLAAWRATGAKEGLGLLVGPLCVGLFLGWQAVLMLTLLTVAVHLVSSVFRRLWPSLRRIPPTAWLALATLVWILTWRSLVSRWAILG